MNCPRCGKPIGGYVQAGSKEATRVSNGCCPHCGCSMPAGYQVGFAKSSSTYKPAKKYNYDDVVRSGKNHPGKSFVCCFAALVGCLFMILDGSVALGIILGVVGALTGLCYYSLYYMSIMTLDGKTTMAPHGNGVAIALISLFPVISVLVSIGAGTLGIRWGWYLGLYGLNTLLAIGIFNPEEEPQKQAEADSMIKALPAIIQKIKRGEIRCAHCGGDIAQQFHMSMDPQKFAVLCDKCVPYKELGNVTEINDIKFYALNMDIAEYLDH